MKKYIALVSVALALLSCTKEQEQLDQNAAQVTIRAYQEGANSTKTTVIDGGTQVYWEAGDVINVFFKGNGGRFVSQNTDLAAVADFVGTFYGLVGANEGAGSTNAIWGLYPYRADATSDGQSVTTTLPDIQTARPGSFAKNTHISLACAHNLDLAFYNVTGGLRFSVSQEGIKSVTFEGNNGEVLAGKIKLAFSNGVPVIQEVTDGKTSITLKAQSGTTFQVGEWYYLSAIPGSLLNGFTITFNTEDKSAQLVSSGSVSFKRGIYGSLANADAGLVYKREGDDVTPENPASPDEIISFADDKVKAKLVAAFDTNQDGELTYAEAAAATSMEGVFGAIKTYKSFDEFQYFTGVDFVPNTMCKDWNLLSSIVFPNSLSKIGVSSFQNCTNLTSIVIPKTVNSIGDDAFSGCTNLASITTPFGGLGKAFQNCSNLRSVVIYEGVNSITTEAFYGCHNLTSITIPNSVSSIEAYAFYGCNSLPSIVIPESVTSIGECAFCGCKSLASIIIPEGVTSVGDCAFEGCSDLVSIVFLGKSAMIGKRAFGSCSSLTHVDLPEKWTSILSSAFSRCASLSSITIPKEVSSIGDYAFYECTNLSSIVLPEKVTTIEKHAFSNCSNLSSVVFTGKATRIENGAFLNCSNLSSIVFPDDYTYIGNSAFSNCSSLKHIELPERVGAISVAAFEKCTSLTSIVIPDSITRIESRVFSDCNSLTTISILGKVTTIENSAFSGCTSLAFIIIPESVSNIENCAFYGCTSLSYVFIPESVTSIGDAAFAYCTSIQSILIPESVTSIGKSAFLHCTEMTSCTLNAETPPSLGSEAFNNNSCSIFVPAISVQTYKAASVWSNYASRISAIME